MKVISTRGLTKTQHKTWDCVALSAEVTWCLSDLFHSRAVNPGLLQGAVLRRDGDAVKAIGTRALPSQLVLHFLALQGNQGLSLQM